MNRYRSVIRHFRSFALTILLLLGLSGTGVSGDTASRTYLPGEILVKFKPGVQMERIRKLHSKLGIIQRSELGPIGVEQLKLPVGLSVDAAIALYQNNADVEYAEPNYSRRAFAFPLDPFISQQWGLHNTAQTLIDTFPLIGGHDGPLPSVDADIDAPEAWDITRGSEDLVVAVIDSGIDYNHPDLGDEDTDNNGVLDPAEDLNNNGVLDVEEDKNNNGILDSKEDKNNNNVVDPGNLWVNPGEDINNNAIVDLGDFNSVDNDGNGYMDDIHGWNFVGSQVCTIDDHGECRCIPDDILGNNDPMDDYGHGTPVAGVIAGKGNNREGIAGVMWTAKIMSLKVLDAVGCGSVGDEIRAIDYAIQKGARIIVLGSGASEYSQSEFEAIEAASTAGIHVIAPAGNEQSDNDALPIYPASYDLPNMISVAASDFNDDLAFFSNFGINSIDLAAPGDCIFSTMPMGLFTLQGATNIKCTDLKYAQQYDYLTGTSFAAAHVAGVAGLLLVREPNLTPAELKSIITSTVDPTHGLKKKVASGGRVNVYRVLTHDTGATFAEGTGGNAGCFGFYLDRRDPGSSGTAVAAMLVMTFPLLLASRRLRRLLGFHRSQTQVSVILIGLFLLPAGISTVDAQEYVEPDRVKREAGVQMRHALALKTGFHLYPNSGFFDSNAAFFDQEDLTSLAAELEYEYLWYAPSTFGLAIGYYDGKTDFETVCCSELVFSTLYALLTLRYKLKPERVKPFYFYAGAGVGYYRFDRDIRVADLTDSFNEWVFGHHYLLGLGLPLNKRLGLLVEARNSFASITSANELDDRLGIGGLTTFFGLSWQFPDFAHILPERRPELPEERVILPSVEKPPEEKVVAPPEEKPVEEIPTP